MERERFQQLVDEAVDGLPSKLRESIHNVAILVADWPTQEQLEEVGIEHRSDLLGLYEGIPLPNRDSGYNMVLPDRITIFQKPIEMRYRSEEKIINKIQRTVQHEIAHYFGISDARLRDIDRY
ncbi:MAG: metallopeptidase family protein [Chloroflexota bacterium]|nr:metallopeptidase family protein [Chloroflexota bacterium]